jgi:hypothetical protein
MPSWRRAGGKLVRSRRQAVAIALHEAGATRQESPKINWETLAKKKEIEGKTVKQQMEGHR